MKKLVFTILLVLPVMVNGQRLRTEGKYIVNSDNEEVILRGYGLGGWMLMEGYMMHSSDVADTQHEFRARLEDLMGVEKTDEFFDSWHLNHVTKRDVDSLAAWGFNSIRLPMHYNLYTLPIEDEPVPGENTWLTKGFEMTDQLLSWCKENSIYLILDLHAAPGGQGFNAAISDYDPSKPSLWESQENRDKTVALWAKLAERYKDEDWIGGYDLINETNWYAPDMGPNNALLKELSVQITNAIRATGDDHIIYIEGNGFANDFTGMTPPWDDNMAYSFHKYWNFNDQGSIGWVLDIREQYDVPLWMGEGGENSNPWFTDAIKLFEDNKIGWSWWPMKRIETIVGPYSILFTQGYKNVLQYWRDYDNWLENGGAEPVKPSEADSYQWMMELAEMSNSVNCDYQKDVHDAMIRQPHTTETIPYDQVNLPGTIFMSNYDLGRHGSAYWDSDYANFGASTGSFSYWNRGWWYRNDAADVERTDDIPGGNGFNLAHVAKGEWTNYTVTVDKAGIYDITVQYASQQSGAVFHLALNGSDITPTTTLSSTGSWTTYDDILIEDVILPAGEQTFTLFIDKDTPANFSKMVFDLKSETIDLPYNALTANTLKTEPSLKVTMNYPVDPATLDQAAADFTIKRGAEASSPVEIKYSEDDPNALELVFDFNLHFQDNLLLSYQGTGIKNIGGQTLEDFSDLKVINMLEPRWIIPDRIQAEDHANMQGFQYEECEDTGGGINLGYADPGDWVEYWLRVDEARDYEIAFRTASQSFQGRLRVLHIEGETQTELGIYSFPSTGGWQTWRTTYDKITLPAGDITLRFVVATGGFNLNWFELEDFVLGIEDITPRDYLVYPNPSRSDFYVSNSSLKQYFIRDLQGKLISSGEVTEDKIAFDAKIRPGTYVLVLTDAHGIATTAQKIIIER